MKATTLGAATTSYMYDGDGKRLRASTGAQPADVTNFLWDRNFRLSQVALEKDGGDTPLRRYIYGVRRHFMSTPAGSSYYITDTLGSAVHVTSATGDTQWTYSYEPFGVPVAEIASGTPPTNRMRYAGEYLDTTGLYHLRKRQHDPQVGRFLQVDPMNELNLGARSPYLYADNRPTALVDPSGLFSEPSRGGLLRAYVATSPSPPPTAGVAPLPSYVDFFMSKRTPLSFGVFGDFVGSPLGFTTVSVRIFGHVEVYEARPPTLRLWVMFFGMEWNTQALLDEFHMRTTFLYFAGDRERSEQSNYCPASAGEQKCFPGVIAGPGELDTLPAVQNRYFVHLLARKSVRSMRANVAILGNPPGWRTWISQTQTVRYG